MNCQVVATRTSRIFIAETSREVSASNSTGSPSAGTTQWRENVSDDQIFITLVPVA